MGYDSPAFTVDTVTIGLPSLITAIIGAIIAILFVVRIAFSPSQLEEKGDEKRKIINRKVQQLGEAINRGATTFLLKEYGYLAVVALALFVLVSAAVNWRTGIW
jgi:Na+/H+-translocating membrane pyrophosphatase